VHAHTDFISFSIYICVVCIELKFQIEKFIHAVLAVKDKRGEIVLRFVIEKRREERERCIEEEVEEERGNLFPIFFLLSLVFQNHFAD
jgi:hypothetical protein